MENKDHARVIISYNEK